VVVVLEQEEAAELVDRQLWEVLWREDRLESSPDLIP
jgi:hypothetical protein